MSVARPALPRLLRKWQKRLRLQDWDITAKYVPGIKITGSEDEHIFGVCMPQPHHSSAEIEILDPRHFPEEYPERFRSVELTFVHEMLHVVFAQAFEHIEEHPALDDLQERLVEQVAKALLEV